MHKNKKAFTKGHSGAARFRVAEEQKSREIWNISAQMEKSCKPDHFHGKIHGPKIQYVREIDSLESAKVRAQRVWNNRIWSIPSW